MSADLLLLPADVPELDPTGRRNCFTCALAGENGWCGALTLDEDEDAPVLAWIQATHIDAAGEHQSLPETTADGCPAWDVTRG